MLDRQGRVVVVAARQLRFSWQSGVAIDVSRWQVQQRDKSRYAGADGICSWRCESEGGKERGRRWEQSSSSRPRRRRRWNVPTMGSSPPAFYYSPLVNCAINASLDNWGRELLQ